MLYPISIQMCIVHGEQNSRHWNKYQDVIYFLFSNSEFLSWYIMKYYKKLLITNYNYWSKSVCQSSVRVCQSLLSVICHFVWVFCQCLLSESVSLSESVRVCQCLLSVCLSLSVSSVSVRVCQSVWVCQSVRVCQSLSVSSVSLSESVSVFCQCQSL